MEEKDFDVLNKFNYCFRYIDDLLCINNDQLMAKTMPEIYPQDLDFDVDIRNGKIHSKLFDKRDAFGFPTVNFPDLSGNVPAKQSYGVFVSQLIRHARCCMNDSDFVSRTKILVDKLVKQGFKPHILKQVFEKFTMKHFKLLFKYNCPINFICGSCF